MQLFRIRQHFERIEVANLDAEVPAQLRRLNLEYRTKPGESVAIAAGSRGIADIATITAATIRFFREHGLDPFVVPAMGSHGGATAAGQREVLERLGLTEDTLGCPIRSCMDTVVLGTCDGIPVHFDRTALGADHVFAINRIKPHTRFRGPVESGLLKMFLVGLGNHAGASMYHKAVREAEFATVIRRGYALVRENVPLLGGLGIVENAFDRPAQLRAVNPEEMVEVEETLLALAKRLLPRLPFEEVDMLLVDRIGKEISGTGMDTNVIGRKSDDHKAAADETPVVRCIGVRGLSEATHGNANGIGMAEFCKSSVLKEIDVRTTRLNAITANHVSAAMLPLDYPTDREMIEAARRTLGNPPWETFRLLWIADTKHLAEIECSAAYLPEARERGLDILTPPRPAPWDANGNLFSQETVT